MTKDCAHCGITFERTYHAESQWASARFCSHSCVAKARHARERIARPTKPCAQCGEAYAKNPRYNADQWERSRYCSRKCQAAAMRVDRSLCLCGCGKRVAKARSVYRQGHNPQERKVFQLTRSRGKLRWHTTDRNRKRVQWARVVMQDVIGRPLRDGEVVHHINGDSTDDRIENLMLFDSHSDHMRYEWAAGNLPASRI